MRKYTVDRDEDTPCFQQKYVYPGLEQWEKLEKHISFFIERKKGNKYIYNGGWAIHHFLKSLNLGLQIYEEDNVCDTTDFDMFGPSPGEDLVELAQYLKEHLPDMTFTINNGMHPNQYTIIVNFLGAKLVDWIYISPKVFKHVPTITYGEGEKRVVCLHPLVELMRQYNMLSNIFLMAPNKDISKALGRIVLLEKHCLEKWIKDNKMWDGRVVRSEMFANYPIVKALSDDNKGLLIELQKRVVGEWFANQKYVCQVGHLAFETHTKIKSTYKVSDKDSYKGVEFVVHDAVFGKCVTSLVGFVKSVYKTEGNRIEVSTCEPFIGVIGPLYNGWVEIKLDGVVLCRMFSLATPVHVANKENRTCSYFFNMAHMMWRALYLRYLKHEVEAKFYDAMVAKTYKTYLRNKTDKLFVVELKLSNAVGVTPVRNFYMMNNLMRAQGAGIKYVVDNKHVSKSGTKPTIDWKYNNYEGKTMWRQTLDKINAHKIPQLPYLYGRIVASNNNK